MELTKEALATIHDEIAAAVDNSKEWPVIAKAIQATLENQRIDFLIAVCAYLIDTLELNGYSKPFVLALLSHHAGIDVEFNIVRKGRSSHEC